MGKRNNMKFYSSLSFLVAPPASDNAGSPEGSNSTSPAFPDRLRRFRDRIRGPSPAFSEESSSNMSRPKVPSIRDKDYLKEDAEVQAMVVEGVGGAKMKTGKRGPVSMKILEKMLKDRKGEKYELSWNGSRTECDIPQSRIRRHIGSIIRNWMPMDKPNFGTLDDEAKALLFYQLHCIYEFKGGDNLYELLEFIMITANDRFREWKHDIKEWCDDWVKTHKTPDNPDPEIPVPLEFIKRPDQFEWLLQHFKSAEFKKLSECGKNAREKNKCAHHGGSMAFVDRALEQFKDSFAPHCQAFIEAYHKEKDDNVHNVEKVVKARKVMEDALAEMTPTTLDECEDSSPSVARPLSLEQEVTLLQQITGKPQKGRLQSGLGKMVKLPTMRESFHGGGASSSRSTNSSEELEELRTRVAQMEEQYLQREAAMKKEMEAQIAAQVQAALQSSQAEIMKACLETMMRSQSNASSSSGPP